MKENNIKHALALLRNECHDAKRKKKKNLKDTTLRRVKILQQMVGDEIDVGVLFYVPNLIGYFRIGIALYSTLVVADPAWFACLHVLTAILDATDGFAARSMNQ